MPIVFSGWTEEPELKGFQPIEQNDRAMRCDTAKATPRLFLPEIEDRNKDHSADGTECLRGTSGSDQQLGTNGSMVCMGVAEQHSHISVPTDRFAEIEGRVRQLFSHKIGMTPRLTRLSRLKVKLNPGNQVGHPYLWQGGTGSTRRSVWVRLPARKNLSVSNRLKPALSPVEGKIDHHLLNDSERL